MSTTVRQALVALSSIAASFLLVGLASSGALDRAQVQRLDIDMAAVIGADYSASPPGMALAPLKEEILDAARADENRFEQTTPEMGFVPIFLTPVSAPEEGDAEASGAATAPSSPVDAAPTPGLDRPERSSTPTRTPTTTPTDCPRLRRGCLTPTPTQAPEDTE